MPQTGLFNADAFGQALGARHRGCRRARRRACRSRASRSTTRSTAAPAWTPRAWSSRLVRNVDFACRQDDGSILFAFADTDLRDAHVVARRLASVLKHTMLRPDRERPGVSPSVTLATLKPTDTPAHAAGAGGAAPGCRRLIGRLSLAGPIRRGPPHVRHPAAKAHHAPSPSTSSRTWSAPGASSESDDLRRPWRSNPRFRWRCASTPISSIPGCRARA